MPAAQKLFLIAWSAVVIVVIALMALLYVSLIPHFGEIGDWMLWVLRIGMICGTALMLTFTYSWIGRLLSKRKYAQRDERIVIAGDVVAYLKDDGTFEHLSAQHVAAGVPRMLPAPPDEKLEATDETIIELYNDGQTTLEQIAKSLNLTYYRVQSVVAVAKQKGLIHRR